MVEKRGYVPSDLEEMGFDVNQYPFPSEAGETTATLVMRKWGKRCNLICYFDTDDGQKLKLIAYRDDRKGGKYTTRENDICMSRQPLGSRWKIKYTITARGNIKVSLEWENGQLKNCEMFCNEDRKCALVGEYEIYTNNEKVSAEILQGNTVFNLQANTRYSVKKY